MTRTIERFVVRQKLTMMVNRYEIRTVDAEDNQGDLIAFAQQKRMALKEEVTFYTDEARSTPVFAFKARQRLDLAATYDVTDAEGQLLGWFRKDFGKSLLRSTWYLATTDGVDAVGAERNSKIAIARRIWNFVPFIGEVPSPFVFHFNFVTVDGTTVLTSVRKRSLKDVYTVTLPVAANGWQLDWRVAAAMAVGLDALQRRRI